MTKQQLIWLFEGMTKTEVAKHLGMSRDGLFQWPEKLDSNRADRGRGCAMRLGFYVPPHLRHSYYDEKGRLRNSRVLGPIKDEDAVVGYRMGRRERTAFTNPNEATRKKAAKKKAAGK